MGHRRLLLMTFLIMSTKAENLSIWCLKHENLSLVSMFSRLWVGTIKTHEHFHKLPLRKKKNMFTRLVVRVNMKMKLAFKFNQDSTMALSIAWWMARAIRHFIWKWLKSNYTMTFFCYIFLLILLCYVKK